MLTAQTDEIADIVEHSFLNRVPEIMAAQPSLTVMQAAEVAYWEEQKLMLSLSNPMNEEQRGIVRELSDAVYRRLTH